MSTAFDFELRASCIAIAAFASISATSVMAQESSGTDDDGLVADEIIVEGELQKRSLQDSPTSAAVITGEELDRSKDLDLYDVIERAPNVTQSFNEKGFSIRGIDQRGPGGGAGSGLLVTTVVDGATLPNNRTTFFGPYSTWDLDQIEILRGPQSTQQGRNALAGAVIINTADPTYELEFKARGDVGSRETLGGAVAVNVPLVDDTLAFRVSAERVQTNGWVENPTLGIDDYDPREQTTVRAKLRFDPTDDFSALLAFTRSENFGGEDFVRRDLFPDQRFNFSDVVAREGLKHNIANLEMTYDVNDSISLVSKSTYYDSDYVRVEDTDQSAFPGNLTDRVQNATTFEQDLRLFYETDRINAVVGGYFTQVEIDDFTVSSLPAAFLQGVPPAILALLPPGTLLNQTATNDTEFRNFAAFGEFEYEVLDDFSFVVGARYDRETRKFQNEAVTTINPAIPLPPGVLPPPTSETNETTYDAFLPKVGVTYDWTDDLSTSFTVQRGYRAGGTQRNPFTGVLNEFDAEFAWNFEAAVRSQWLDDRLTANVNVYFQRLSNQQVNVNGPSGLTADFNTVNAGSSRTYGGELDLRFQATDNLEVFGSLGIAQTEFVDFVDNNNDFGGNQFVFASPVTAAFGGSYAFDNGITLSADASYTSSAYQDAANTIETDARFLVNASVGYEEENWSVALWARNLLDNDYILQTQNFIQVGAMGPAPVPHVRTGEPLTIGLTATLKLP